MNTGVGMSPRRVCSSPARARSPLVLNTEKPIVTASAHRPARRCCQPLRGSTHEPVHPRGVRVAGIAHQKSGGALAGGLLSAARDERLDGHDLGFGAELAVGKISAVTIG